MAQTIIYDGNNYSKFAKSVHDVTGLYINTACSYEDDDTSPLFFCIGKEYHPKHKQKEIYCKVNQGCSLMFAPKELIRFK